MFLPYFECLGFAESDRFSVRTMSGVLLSAFVVAIVSVLVR
jgi:hypothetical protein